MSFNVWIKSGYWGVSRVGSEEKKKGIVSRR